MFKGQTHDTGVAKTGDLVRIKGHHYWSSVISKKRLREHRDKFVEVTGLPGELVDVLAEAVKAKLTVKVLEVQG